MAIPRAALIWIEPPLASGGMGQVWRVIQCGAKEVRNISVVKRILLPYTSSEEFKEMFINEARINAQLHRPTPHPNIIQILEFQEFENEYLLFMEYVNGQDLFKIFHKCRIKKIPFPIPFAIHIVIEVLSGLHHAHYLADKNGNCMNIIHRDVSPPNILVSYSGDVKIIDWGIARTKLKATHTQVGLIKGKYGYMSPEQANASELDHRTDIFSAGIILWEMTTGKKLFGDVDNIEALKKTQESRIEDPRECNKNISQNLANIILKAMARGKDNRFKDCHEFSKALIPERNLLAPDFGKGDLAKFLKNIFDKEIKNDQELIARAEKKEPSEIPPYLNQRDNPEKYPTELDRRKKGKPKDFSKLKSGIELEHTIYPSTLSEDVHSYKRLQNESIWLSETGSELKKADKPPLEKSVSFGNDSRTSGISVFTGNADFQKIWEAMSKSFLRMPIVQKMMVLSLPAVILPLIVIASIYLIVNTPKYTSLEITSPLKDLKIRIAGITRFKKEAGPIFIENIPYEKKYLVKILKKGCQPIIKTISIDRGKKQTITIEKMIPSKKRKNLTNKMISMEKAYQISERNLFSISCKRGDLKDCFKLGVIEQKLGKITIARKTFQKACYGGHQAACNALGNLEMSRGRLSAARIVYTKSCIHGNLHGCNSLGFVELQSGHIRQARKHFKKACKGGMKQACAEIKKLPGHHHTDR